jgi:hypothetical protein
MRTVYLPTSNTDALMLKAGTHAPKREAPWLLLLPERKSLEWLQAGSKALGTRGPGNREVAVEALRLLTDAPSLLAAWVTVDSTGLPLPRHLQVNHPPQPLPGGLRMIADCSRRR